MSSSSEQDDICIYSTVQIIFLPMATFQVVPKLWKQQYTFHLNFSGFNLPVIYALLPGKTKNMYLTLLRKVKDMIGDDVHCPWIFDFELSMINAHKEIFNHTSSLGCFFHLTKAVHRKVDSMGFRQKYMEDATFRHRVMSLSSLAFVEMVGQGFDSVRLMFPFEENGIPNHFEAPTLVQFGLVVREA